MLCDGDGNGNGNGERDVLRSARTEEENVQKRWLSVTRLKRHRHENGTRVLD
jgi:hypothetical protein